MHLRGSEQIPNFCLEYHCRKLKLCQNKKGKKFIWMHLKEDIFATCADLNLKKTILLRASQKELFYFYLGIFNNLSNFKISNKNFKIGKIKRFS